MHFYEEVIRKAGVGPDESIVVTCGGTFDIQVLQGLGFRNVTITNLDTQYAEQSKPFEWVRQDAEAMTFAQGSFDWAFVHAGLHHCASPHRALLEMLRVTRKGVLVIEARDSLLIRTAARLHLTENHEVSAVRTNGMIRGGLANGSVPNYIYRWTEREVRKTVESAFPQRVNDVRFFYGLREPVQGTSRPVWLAVRALQSLVPRQCNSFGFVIRHTCKLKPWMADSHTVKSS